MRRLHSRSIPAASKYHSPFLLIYLLLTTGLWVLFLSIFQGYRWVRETETTLLFFIPFCLSLPPFFIPPAY